MPDADLLEELFEPVGGVRFRRMFSGTGIFKNGLMFGLVVDDALHLKADTATSPRYEAEGCGPWIHRTRNRAIPTSYWRVPERLFDKVDEFRQWADEAFAVARRKAAAKKPAAPKTKKKAAPKRRKG